MAPADGDVVRQQRAVVAVDAARQHARAEQLAARLASCGGSTAAYWRTQRRCSRPGPRAAARGSAGERRPSRPTPASRGRAASRDADEHERSPRPRRASRQPGSIQLREPRACAVAIAVTLSSASSARTSRIRSRSGVGGATSERLDQSLDRRARHRRAARHAAQSCRCSLELAALFGRELVVEVGHRQRIDAFTQTHCESLPRAASAARYFSRSIVWFFRCRSASCT